MYNFYLVSIKVLYKLCHFFCTHFDIVTEELLYIRKYNSVTCTLSLPDTWYWVCVLACTHSTLNLSLYIGCIYKLTISLMLQYYFIKMIFIFYTCILIRLEVVLYMQSPNTVLVIIKLT